MELAAITSKETGYLKVETDNYISKIDGKIAIAEEDLKILIRMTGDVNLTETEENIVIKNGKRKVSLMKHDLSGFPEEPDGNFEPMIQMKEVDFAETITGLAVFTSDSDANPSMSCLNFNLIENRIEGLDGYRAGMKYIEESEKIGNKNFMIHNTIVQDLKKVLDKKADENIVISIGNKSNKIVGKNFTYYARNIKGVYFKVSQMIPYEFSASCVINTEGFFNHIKYYTDNVIKKTDKNPVVFKVKDGKIVTYAKNTRFAMSDELKIDDFRGKEFNICFNPYYLLDALKIADNNTVCVNYNKSKNPMIMKANKYSFLILPVKGDEEIKSMETYLNKLDAA